MNDWAVVASVIAALFVVFVIRSWAARRNPLRAGATLFVISLPVLLALREAAAKDLIQSQALIWPLIVISTSIPVLSLMLLARGGWGMLRNEVRKRRIARHGRG